jgi:predicted transcriptional regulator of viral defense system
MAGLAAQGWVRRIRRGVFLVIPAKAPDPEQEVARDPDAVADALFGPCYIGGWSAAPRWGLDAPNRVAIFVVTASRVRRRSVLAEGHRFHLVHAPAERIAGPGVVEAPYGGAPTSGPERTIVDALARPGWLGGATYLANALVTHRESPDWDEDRFVDVMQAIGTGASYRRLGALIDSKRIQTDDLRRQAYARRAPGLIDLEPGSPKEGPLDSFWRVRLNADLQGWDLPEDEDIADDFLEGVDDPDP